MAELLVNTAHQPFWREKSLAEMSQEEWEALCDGCGRCCLNKLEDWDTGEIHFTNVACKLFDDQTCRCSNYENRFKHVPDCTKLEPQDIAQYTWLPPTCAYRLLEEGKDLPDWHPLVSGSAETVHTSGVSVRGRTVSEVGKEIEEWEDFVVEWPGQTPEEEKNS